MFIGVGCSPLVNMSFAMFALVGYFMLSIYVYIDCHLKGEMRLTFGKLGPTEFRIILIIVNILFMYIPWLSTWKKTVWLFHNEFQVGLFDYIAWAVAVLLIIFYIVGFFRDAAYYAKIDPPKNKEN